MKVNVEVAVLLEKLKENRNNHRQLFWSAQKAYKAKAVEVLEQRLDDAREGRKVNQYLGLIEPVDQTEEYDTAIAMMEMAVGGTIELDQQTFQCYVLDKWSWAESTTMSNTTYLS